MRLCYLRTKMKKNRFASVSRIAWLYYRIKGRNIAKLLNTRNWASIQQQTPIRISQILVEAIRDAGLAIVRLNGNDSAFFAEHVQ